MQADPPPPAEGLGEKEGLSWEEISRHTEVGDCWIVIEGLVYDISEYMKRHPGGRWILLEVAGTDATQRFLKTIHSEVAYDIMEGLCIGKVV